MRVVFIAPSTLNYQGKTFAQGDELEITETFFNNHTTRFKKLDDNFVIDAEFTEIKNVNPEATEIKNVKPKKKKGSAQKLPESVVKGNASSFKADTAIEAEFKEVKKTKKKGK